MNSSVEKYRKELEQNCQGGEGLPDIIKEVPQIFTTLESLIRDKDLSNKERLKVFAAIGYFFIPDDLFPEEILGQEGYIDDVILCLAIFNEINRTDNGNEVLKRNWTSTRSIEEMLEKDLPFLMIKFPKQYIGVLDHFGLLPDDIDIDLE